MNKQIPTSIDAQGPNVRNNSSGRQVTLQENVKLHNDFGLTAGIVKLAKKNGYNTHLLGSPSRGDLIVPILIEYINDMKFAEGDKLPSEIELSSTLGVGARSLREALLSLKMLGLVQSRHGAGWYVAKFDPATNLSKILSPLLQRFSGADILQVFEARLGVEPLIALLAAKNITKEGLERLGQVLEVMRQNANKNMNEFFSADRKFHDILAQECGNIVLLLQNSILAGLFQSMLRVVPEATAEVVLHDHEEMYIKVKAGDAEGAATVAKRHVELAIQLIHKHGLR
jgi:GntR family transcriptional regulator, transcriptional repressor for pyruvate dehydrogenase complex